MKIFDIISKVGTGIVRSFPGGDMVVDVVNEFLPHDKKLDHTATGEQIGSIVQHLPPELLDREFDIQIAQHETIRAMIHADATQKHTTRPYIAKGAFHVVAFAVVASITTWAFGVVTGDADMVSTVVDGWPFVLGVIGPLVTLLWAYFGVLKNEHRDKLGAATGSDMRGGVAKLLTNLIRR